MQTLRKTIIIFAVSVMLLPFKAEADNDTNRFEHYRKQFAKLHDSYLRAPDDVANIAALAYFYSEPDNPMRNLPLAKDYIQISEKRYKELIGDNKRYRDVNKLIKKGFTLVELRQRHKMITDEARKYVKNGLQPDETDAFLRAFADDKVITKEISQQKSVHSYNKAIELNTEKAYKEYLDNPQNTYERDTIVKYLKDLLKQKINVATTEQTVDEIAANYDYPEIKKLAEERKSDINYHHAIAENTTEAYTTFLRRFPTSDKYDLVLATLDTLAYKEFQTLSTPRQYADFAQKYSDLPPSEQAVDSLISLAVNTLNKEAMDIYLEEFKSDAHYNDVYKSYYLRYSSEGNKAPIQLFDSLNPDFPLKFLITDDLKTAEKIDKTPFLLPFDENTTAKNADLLKMFMGKGINYVLLQRLIQPYTSKANWKNAIAFMNKYEICFDNAQNQYYKQLKQLVSENVKAKAAPIFTPRYNINNPQLSSSGLIYANKVLNISTQVVAININKKQSPEAEVPIMSDNDKDITFFSLSNDEKTMLVGQNGNIYSAIKHGNEWRINDLEAEGLNTMLYYEGDASFTPDGMGMLFVSDRPEGYNVNISGSLFHGDTALASDIYYMPRTANGWGTPINLGPVINSPFSERSPVLSRDLTTLYFTSDRYGGMGFYDIWMATRTNTNSWTEWSTPVNIGKIANTSFSEPNISLSPDEEYLYFTSNSPNMSRYSLNRCRTKHKTKPFFRTVSINCNNIANLQNLAIDVVDLPSNITIHHYQTNDSISSLKFDIYATKKYLVQCSKEEYFIPITLLSEEKNTATPQAYKLKACITYRTHIPLSIVTFVPQTAKLLPYSQAEIIHLAKLLKKYPKLKIEIISNVTGDNATEAYNLSLQRSETIKKALCRQNIEPQRIVASGFGNINYKKSTTVTAVEIILFEE